MKRSVRAAVAAGGVFGALVLAGTGAAQTAASEALDALGKGKAMDMVWTARMMDAAEAERAGLVSRIVAADKLIEEALSAAATICGFGLPAVMMAKQCVNRAFESGLGDGVAFERQVFHSLFATEDQKEGMAAFVAKRKAAFKHR